MTITDRDATDPLSFAWVSANAGSGKTRLLIDRVTRLLLHGANVSRILCLTYTKAAAAEMATRLFDRLGGWALLPDETLLRQLAEIGANAAECSDLRVARRLFAQALETPGGLKIQTIHAFCQHLLARFPVEAGIPARFSVMDERSAIELLGEARAYVLQQSAREDSPLRNSIGILAARASDGRFGEILDTAIADRGKLAQLLARYGGDAEIFFRHLGKVLDIAAGETEQQIVSQICAEVAAEKVQLLRVAQWLTTGSAADQETAARITAVFDSGIEAEQYRRLKTLFFTGDHKPRTRLITHNMQAAQPALAQSLQTIQDRLAAADDRKRRCVTAALTEALLRTAFAVLDRFERMKRERALLDYNDLITSTIRLLQQSQSAEWVLYKLDGGIDHILVDEGQDTSPDQWRIISALSAEFFTGQGARPESHARRLFVVGDEKQSIFSFQGAEPAAFGEYRARFKRLAEDAYLPFVDFRPAISRRSARSILSFLDAVFDSEAARDGLTTESDPIHHDPHRQQTGRVEIWPCVPAPERVEPDPLAPVDTPAPGAHTELAARIAGRVARMLKNGATAPGGDQPLTPGDIMILVRRRNMFAEEMIRQLQKRGVPVAGADRMVLTEQIAVLDLLALGNFAVLPEDDLNLASLLKSPIIGFGETDIYDLAQPRTATLWTELCRRSNEREIFAQAHEFLKTALSDADFRAPFEFYSRILNRGVRKRLVARLGLETDDAIDEFLALALMHEASHPPSLQSFLNWCAATGSDVKRDMEQGGGMVRVMTVHGAKGLEAKVVILPDSVQIPDHERREPLLYTDDCVFFGVPKPLECDAIAVAKTAAHESEMREYRRLLYVAATRARDVLVICGYLGGNRKNPPPDCWYSLLQPAARKLGRAEEIDSETMLVIGDPFGCSEVIPECRQKRDLPGFLTRPAEIERMLPLLRPSRITGDEPPAMSPAGINRQRLRQGILAHALLARLPEVAAAQRENAALGYLKRRGIAEADAQSLTASILRVLNDAEFAPLFGDDSRAEVAFTAAFPELGGGKVHGQIDRLAVTATSVLIADFKTNRQIPDSAEVVPRAYRAQMALYREALRRIYPGKAVHCALIWTDSALLMPIPDAVLEEEFAALASTATAISAT